jgi:hypothetical protein
LIIGARFLFTQLDAGAADKLDAGPPQCRTDSRSWLRGEQRRGVLHRCLRDVDIGRFEKPVRVALGGPGKIRVVTSTREAAECLLLRWPYESGRNHLAARKACRDVLQGLKEARTARKAFEQAAAEADILVE